MRKVKWSEIDIEDELSRLESMLSTSLYMNFDDEKEYSIAAHDRPQNRTIPIQPLTSERTIGTDFCRECQRKITTKL